LTSTFIRDKIICPLSLQPFSSLATVPKLVDFYTTKRADEHCCQRSHVHCIVLCTHKFLTFPARDGEYMPVVYTNAVCWNPTVHRTTDQLETDGSTTHASGWG
jgi:hypothetical protein